jgi:hypothetical protein
MKYSDFIEEEVRVSEFGDDIITIKDKNTGVVLEEWHDNACVDYPEDLTWNRDIGSLFVRAFELGLKYGGRNETK